MEWTGQQQVFFFLQSVVLGMPVGLLLDVLTGLLDCGGRRHRLWQDVFFGPVAALLIFLGSLVIMDGHLHPLLLFGSFLGMIAEHVSLGWLVRKILKSLVGLVRKCKGFLTAWVLFLNDLLNKTNRFARCNLSKRRKTAKKGEK